MAVGCSGEKNMGKLTEAKNKIKAAVQADEMIEKCQVCSERKKEIVAHHPTVKNPATALIHILKCNQCRPILFAVRQCASEGHIITEENP